MVQHIAFFAARTFASALLAGAVLVPVSATSVRAQDARQQAPEVPSTLEAPEGHRAFLIARAVGTQNYICQLTPTGTAWRLFGPQATLFQAVGDTLRKQVATHFLSANPAEPGTTRPTWQDSSDSSRVWARVAADAVTVDSSAIPWLLLEIVGAVPGTTGGGKLTQTTFIQRVNTVGGLADPATCSDPSRVGATVLVPYQADYVFYRAQGHR